MLWALSAVIVLLASHVLLGWVRQAQAVAAERRHWFAVAMAAGAFGTALSAAVALSLSGESLAFPMGYQRLSAVGLWLGSVAILLPAMMLLAFWPSLFASLGAGVLAGGVATAVEVGWVTAAGFRPGVIWNRELLMASWLVCSTGFAIAFALGFPRAERAQHYRYSWRIAAAALMALSFVASLALVIMGAGLPTQVGSIYRHELSGTTVSLLGGGVLPLVLVMMIVDLEVRRRQRRRVKRKKRRDAQASRFATFEMPDERREPMEPVTHPVYTKRSRAIPGSLGPGVPLAASAGAMAQTFMAQPNPLMQQSDTALGLEAAWAEANADFATGPQPALSPYTPVAGQPATAQQPWTPYKANEAAAAHPPHDNTPAAAVSSESSLAGATAARAGTAEPALRQPTQSTRPLQHLPPAAPAP